MAVNTMKEQKTPEQVLEENNFFPSAIVATMNDVARERLFNAMQSYSDQQNAELRGRVKELEAQNKRLKIAHYTIVRAYEEYGPLASVSTKQVSENVLKEIGLDPSKETL